MKLIIVRHGETFENYKQITQGHYDSQLTPHGLTQARILSQRLRNENIDVIVSSDLRRCMHTAEVINTFHDVPVLSSELLREQARGAFEGMPKTWSRDYVDLLAIPYHLWLPEGGETMVDLWDKVIPYFEALKKERSDETVLYVGHGGPIACLLTHLHGETIESWNKYKPELNTSVSIADITGKAASFKKVNCSEHLRVT
jgi:broad specificity phosphatase PhoE